MDHKGPVKAFLAPTLLPPLPPPYKYRLGGFMALTIQTICLATSSTRKQMYTMPAEHLYPFIIHRSVEETIQKEEGKRLRYTRTHVVSHVYTGAQLGLFPSYEVAQKVVGLLIDDQVWIMPTNELLVSHPDWDWVSKKCREIKKEYGQ